MSCVQNSLTPEEHLLFCSFFSYSTNAEALWSLKVCHFQRLTGVFTTDLNTNVTWLNIVFCIQFVLIIFFYQGSVIIFLWLQTLKATKQEACWIVD